MPALKVNQFKINQAAKFLGVSSKTLRRWEERSVLVPTRTSGNQRVYELGSLVEFRRNLRNIRSQARKAPVFANTTEPNKILHIERRPQKFIKEFEILPAQKVILTSFAIGLIAVGSLVLLNKKGIVRISDLEKNQTAVSNALVKTRKDIGPSILAAAFPSINPFKRVDQNIAYTSLRDQAVLAAVDIEDSIFGIGIPSKFAKDVEVVGNLTAPNITYKVTAGTGISVTGGQNPVVALAGDALNSFDTITVGTADIVAEGSDTLTFAAGSNVSISVDETNKKLTISSTDNNTGNVSGWTDDGTTVHLTTLTDTVTINGIANIGDGADAIALSGSTVSFDDSNLSSPITLTTSATGFTSGDTGIVDAINTAYSAATGGSGGVWSLTANVIHPTIATNDVAVGGSTLAASIFSIDESAGTFLFGGDQSANPTLTFEATDNDTGNFGFNTNDAFYFTGANVGIGTNAPAVLLELSGTVSGSAENLAYFGSTLNSTTTNQFAFNSTANIAPGSSASVQSFAAGLFGNSSTSNLTGGGTVGALYASGNYSGSGTLPHLHGITAQNGLTSGTVTESIALRVRNPDVSGATLTTNYGTVIEDQTAGTTDYGLAIEGADTQVLWLSSAANNTDAANGIAFGSSRDTNLYRSASDTLKTDSNLVITDDSYIGLGSGAGRIEFDDQSTDEVNFLNAYVGIGTSTPTRTLTVGGSTSNEELVLIDGTITSTTGGFGLSSNPTFSPSSAAADYYFGTSSLPVSNSTNLASSGLLGIYAASYFYGSGTLNESFGAFLENQVDDTATVNFAYSLYVDNPIKAAGATLTTNYGIFVNDQTSGTSDYGIVVTGADTQVLWLSSGADNTDAANGIAFGASRDTNLYRSAASTLKTNGDLVVNDGDLLTSKTTATLFNTNATTLSLGGAATSALNIGNDASAYTAINIGSGAGTHTINIAGTGAMSADTINIGTGGTSADIINIGSGAGGTKIDLTTGTGSQKHTSSVVSGTGANAAFRFADNALTTGEAMSVSARSTPTTNTAINENLFDIDYRQATNANTNGFVGFGINFTNAPTVAGNTEYAARIQNQVTVNTTDNAVAALLVLDNADTSGTGSTVVTDALRIANSGAISGGITNAINIASSDVTTDIALQNGETIDNNVDNQINLNTGVAGTGDGIYIDSGATTSTANGLCHSGADADNAAFSDRQIVACAGTVDADFAEQYPVATGVDLGDIVVLGTKQVTTKTGLPVRQLVKSTSAYQASIIGVVSNNTSDFASAGYDIPDTENPKPIALVGRVMTKVSSENGPIAVGDYITASSVPGVGMKAIHQGMIVGRAISAYDNSNPNEVGKVMVFVNTGWVDPNNALAINSNGELTGQDPNDQNNYQLQIADLDQRLLALENQSPSNGSPNTVETQSQIDLLSLKLDYLQSQIETLKGATGSAELSQTATSSSTFTDLLVLGNAILPDTLINGKLDIGTITIDNSDTSINSINSLKIQPMGISGVDFLGGKVEIDTHGNISINEGVIKGNDSIRGSINIAASETSVNVDKSGVWETPPSVVQVTPNYNTQVWVTNLTKNGFTVNVSAAPTTTSKDLYWTAIW